jgi:hypothetical protein
MDKGLKGVAGSYVASFLPATEVSRIRLAALGPLCLRRCNDNRI